MLRLAALGLWIGCLVGCSEAQGQGGDGGRSERLKQNIRMKSPLTLGDYQSQEAKANKALEGQLSRVEKRLDDLSSSLEALNRRLDSIEKALKK